MTPDGSDDSEQPHALPDGAFDRLGPREIIAAVEQLYGYSLDGTVERYASYVNRVYGLRTEEGERLVVKFYRPGRWTVEAIAEEHDFIRDLSDGDVPVVVPLPDRDDDTVSEVEFDDDGALTVPMALFPRRGGRSFDAERDEDWYRLGTVVGRLHSVGQRGRAPERTVLTTEWSREYLRVMRRDGVIHPNVEGEFLDLCGSALERIAPLLDGQDRLRIHGDCHRGNILDRPGEGLLLIDFDDMMNGPAIQDLWLLLPGRLQETRRELTMLLEGYEEFQDLEYRQLDLVEPLRFMRMIHYLAWQAQQRHDHWFRAENPEWGNYAFWVKELEDLREQTQYFPESITGAQRE